MDSHANKIKLSPKSIHTHLATLSGTLPELVVWLFIFSDTKPNKMEGKHSI